ncbi:DeoR family transcriptional regulator [bacterium]|nr:DeoR family transcriptional regulator [bacterium]
MRKLGADILANLIFILEGAFYQSREIIDNTRKDIEALLSFFGVVKTLDWIDSKDLLEIEKEYSKISNELKKISEIQAIKISEVEKFEWRDTKKESLPQQKTLLEEKNNNRDQEEQSNRDLDEDEGVDDREEGIELSQLEPKNSLSNSEEKFGFSEKERNFIKDASSDSDNDSKSFSEDLHERQKKILEILREKGNAQVKDFKKIFPSVSKRTLRRDFRYLMEKGLVRRIGERNNTFYQLVDRTNSSDINVK